MRTSASFTHSSTTVDGDIALAVALDQVDSQGVLNLLFRCGRQRYTCRKQPARVARLSAFHACLDSLLKLYSL